MQNGGTPNYGTGSTLIYNSGATYGISNEWVNGSGSTAPFNVTIKNSTAFSFGSINSSRTVRGDISVESGSSLALSTVSGGDIVINGNWNRQGTFNANSRQVEFNGATDNTITGNGGINIPFLLINKSAGNRVTLQDDFTITNRIILTQGILDLSTKKLTYSGSTFTRTNGTIEAGSGTVEFTGSTAVNIPAGTFAGNIANFTVNNAAGVTLNSDRTITTALTLTSGALSIGTTTLNLSGSLARTSGTISAASGSVIFSGSSAQTIPSGTFTGATVNNLTVNNTAGVTRFGNLTVTTNFTVNGLFIPEAGDIFNGGTLTGTGTVRVLTTGNNAFSTQYAFTNHTLANLTVQFTGAAQQGVGGSVTSFGPVTIDNAAGVVMNGSITIGGALNLTNGSLTLSGNTLTANGTISGSGSLTGSSASNLILGGTGSTLNFTETSASTRTLRHLTLNSNATATLGNALEITAGNNPGIVTVGSGASLTSNGKLTLKSDATGTASVGNSAGTIIGNVTVERFVDIPKQGSTPVTTRRYRVLTSPVQGATLNASWQEGMVFDGLNGNTFKLTGTNTTTTPPVGYGTMMTGRAQQDAATANPNGFDIWNGVQNNVSSIRYYQGGPTGGQWLAPSSTLFPDAFNRQQAYLVFIRGDRSVYAPGGPATTTLRASGPLKQGDTVSATIIGKSAQNYTLLGNPYASQIDFKNIIADNSTKIEDLFWVWNAALGTGTGSYSILQPDEATPGNYEMIPAPLNSTTGSSPANSIIASGQGFFVEPKGNDNTMLVFKESYKTTSAPNTQLLRQAGVMSATAKLYMNLNTADAGGNKILLDGVLAQYNEAYATSPRNIGKAVNNNSENLSVFKNGSDLIVASQTGPKNGDVLQLRLWRTSEQDYQFDVQGQNFAAAGLTAVLDDKFTGTQTPLPLTGAINTIHFSVTADAASKDSLRFRILFSSPVVLPLVISSLQAQEIAGKVQVNWTVENEDGIRHYTVERSGNGQSFTPLATTTAHGASGTQRYNAADAAPELVNYYRIKMTGTNGEIRYSAVVKVELKNGRPNLLVYPNPVQGRLLQLQLQNQAAGNYSLRLINTAGQTILQQQMRHAGGSQATRHSLPAGLPAGVYRLELTSESGGRQLLEVLMN